MILSQTKEPIVAREGSLLALLLIYFFSALVSGVFRHVALWTTILNSRIALLLRCYEAPL